MKTKAFLLVTAVFLLVLVLTLAPGCSSELPPPDNGHDPGNGQGPDPEPEPPEPDEFDFARYQPNELGEIPVFMYHHIASPESIWTRTPDNFRADLQRFYDAGFRLVSLTDVFNNNIDIPAGTSPLVLTFDDGTPGHFRWLKVDGELVVDPDCAVGIIMEFAKENPDMGTAATFYVNQWLLRQDDSWYTEEHHLLKLEKLVEWGMDIGNHAWTHAHLTKDIQSVEQLQRELGALQHWLGQQLPGYRINSLALPYGSKPVEQWMEYLYHGSYQGVEYSHDVVLLVGSVPAKPPNHIGWSPRAMPRIRASNTTEQAHESPYLDQALKRLESTRYISDGAPDIITIPEHMREFLNPDSLGEKTLRVYDPEDYKD